ncbi:Rieske (2Fe-2S) protein [soil metagenome]
MTSALSRRTLLAGGCVLVGGCVVGVAGCSGGDRPPDRPASDAPIPVSEVPVGGGAVFADRDVVLTQPTAGAFQAFSAICTHQGCRVNEVVDGTINCPCHGSKYSVEDGSVVMGPAPLPLPRREVTVDGDSLRLG